MHKSSLLLGLVSQAITHVAAAAVQPERIGDFKAVGCYTADGIDNSLIIQGGSKIEMAAGDIVECSDLCGSYDTASVLALIGDVCYCLSEYPGDAEDVAASQCSTDCPFEAGWKCGFSADGHGTAPFAGKKASVFEYDPIEVTSTSATHAITAGDLHTGTGGVVPHPTSDVLYHNTTSGSWSATTKTRSSSPGETTLASYDPNPPVIAGFVSIGCLASGSDSSRWSLKFTSATLSLESCVAACSENKYAAAHSTECFCADSLGAQTTTEDPGSCDIACPGNPDQFCGGNTGSGKKRDVPAGYLLSAYQNLKFVDAGSSSNSHGAPVEPSGTFLPPFVNGSTVTATLGPVPTAHVGDLNNPLEIDGYFWYGCFGSDNAFADFKLVKNASDLTLESCVATCKAGSYAFAGALSGNCYCAGPLPASLVPEPLEYCDTLCPGDGTETCGHQSSPTLLFRRQAGGAASSSGNLITLYGDPELAGAPVSSGAPVLPPVTATYVTTVQSTTTWTITACPPDVHDCPVGRVTRTVCPVTTTVCPTPIAVGPPGGKNGPAPAPAPTGEGVGSGPTPTQPPAPAPTTPARGGESPDATTPAPGAESTGEGTPAPEGSGPVTAGAVAVDGGVAAFLGLAVAFMFM